MTVVNLTGRECATILAALRMWQKADESAIVEFTDIASNEDQFVALNADEIDALCENKINTTGTAEDFVHVGTVDVDAGAIWIGDPCYVLKDPDQPRPKDLGKDWGDICQRFFDRSGYSAQQSAWQDYMDKARMASTTNPELREMFQKAWETRPSKDAPREEQTAHFEDYRAASKAFEEKWQKENPFETEGEDTGVANFTHDLGHGGMGIMMSTNFGDGSYPVHVKYAGGRPSLVVIDFYGEQDEDLATADPEVEDAA